ncbi:hypothetical protein Pelo_13809 [Pelomyxa schiedti]|nr:hypothetical protein Pelo_13809 [Pelomyxa schiedti]
MKLVKLGRQRYAIYSATNSAGTSTFFPVRWRAMPPALTRGKEVEDIPPRDTCQTQILQRMNSHMIATGMQLTLVILAQRNKEKFSECATLSVVKLTPMKSPGASACSLFGT